MHKFRLLHIAGCVPMELILLAVFGVVLVASNWDLFNIPCDKTGDHAIIAIGVEKAKLFEAFVGPYSRHHFMHPGPIASYLYAAGNFLFRSIGSPYGRYDLTQLALNLLFLGVACTVVAKHLHSRVWPLLLFVFALSIFPTDRASFFSSIWGPATLSCPMLAFILISPAIAMGDLSWIAVWAFAGSFLVSNHVGTAAVAIPIGLFSLFLCGAEMRRRNVRFTKLEVGSLGVGLLVIFLAALGPLIDAVQRPHLGNIGQLADFMLHERQRKSMISAGRYLLHYFDIDIFGLARIPGAAVLCCTLLVPWIRDFQAHPYERRLRVILSLSVLLAFIAAVNIKGSLHAYILWWTYALVVCMLLFALYSVSGFTRSRFSPLEPRESKLAFTVACLLALYSSLFSPQHRLLSKCTGNGVYDSAISRLNLDRRTLYQVANRGGTVDWPKIGGLVLSLYRNNYSVCVPDALSFIFGDDLRCPSKIQGGYGRLKLVPNAKAREEQFSQSVPFSEKLTLGLNDLSPQ